MSDTLDSLRDRLLQLQQLQQAGDITPEAYARNRADLERRLADLVTASPPAPPPAAKPAPVPPAPGTQRRPPLRLVALVAVAAVAIAVLGYTFTGSPRLATGAGAEAQPAAANAPHPIDDKQVAAMVDKLVARLKDKPDDFEGWTMLGRTQMALRKPQEAIAAYRKALALRADDASLLADLADALAVQNGRTLEGEPMQLVQRALKADPDNLKALMLAGTDAFDRGDFAAAARHWDRVAQVGPADHPLVKASLDAAAEARERGKLPPAPAAAATPSLTAVGATLKGSVDLAPALKAGLSPDDTVFVFARPAEGSRMPLAMLRKQVRDLPITFTLDDSMAMTPAAKISTGGRMVVGARISKSGQAMPQPGDIEGFSQPVSAGTDGIRVQLATVVK